METLVPILVFISVLFLIEIGYFALKAMRSSEKRQVRQRLQTFSMISNQYENIDILRKRHLSEVPWLNRLLSNYPVMDELNRFLEQAGTQHKVGVFLLSSLLFAFIGYLGGLWFISHSFKIFKNELLAIPFALIFGLLPFFYMKLKKKRRMDKFQGQLPEALDLVARSLKAGHALSGGLKMVSDEMGDPVGTEFAKTMNEINYGIGVAEALKNLANRVDCSDLKFFVISVIMQRETGGNLAEILEKLSYLIRERFKLQGRVRILSAQGRLTAYVLLAMPVVMALVISFLKPGHFDVFFVDPIGKALLMISFLLMIVGIFVMKKLVTIRV